MKRWNYVASGFCACTAIVMALCHRPGWLIIMFSWGLLNFIVAEGSK